jgi:Zn-dependent protease with chaperone function
MGFTLRAAGVLVLLAGHFALGAVLLAAVAGLDVFLVTHRAGGYGAAFEGGLVIATLAVAAGILRGMYVFLRAGRLGPPPRALRVTPEDQPELWEQIDAVAMAAGKRVPEEVFLDFEVNASVLEQHRLLGLLPSRRRMVLGAPLVASLTVPQLRAVIAHEFGHYGSRLGAVAVRGRIAMVHTAEVFTGDIGWFDRAAYLLYARYAELYLRLSQALARDLELAADRAAVCQEGPAATAEALRALPVLSAAQERYVAAYATMGAPVGALPPEGEFYGGYLRFLDARPEGEPAALAEGRRRRPPHKYDSHPPDTERLAAIEAAPDAAPGAPSGTAAPGDAPARALLRDPAGVLAALEAAALPHQMARFRRLSWDDLVLARARHDAETWSRPLRQTVVRAQGAPAADAGLPELEAVLDAFDDGILWTDVVPRLPKPASAGYLTGEAARNYIRPRLFDALAGLVHLRLLDAGLAAPDPGWRTSPGLVLPPEWECSMDAALDAAIADTPDTAPLRALLAATAARPAVEA